MLISLNKIKSYTPVDLSTDELIRLIGSRLVEVEGSIDLTPKYKDIKIVKVVSAEKIPDTHLTLCQIDCGIVDKTEQVVCGAPNVHQGMLAAWLQPGCIVPATYGNENFKLSVRKLRGYESHGMLAAADELDLGTDHAGIIEIDPKMRVIELPDGSILPAPEEIPRSPSTPTPEYTGEGILRPVRPGDDFAAAFDLNDVILDIENKSLTHRPDCFGLIGFAREVAGILGQKFEEPKLFDGVIEYGSKPLAIFSAASRSHDEGEHVVSVSTSCETVECLPSGDPQLRRGPSDEPRDDGSEERPEGKRSAVSLNINITDPNICPCYSCAIIDINPDHLEQAKYFTRSAAFLAKSGMRSISPIVDVTNIVMLETGQPLHAFDYDKFVQVGVGNKSKTPEILVRLARPGEKLQLLDGKTIECTKDDILITSGDTPVALAGAMGGANTEIDASTRRIILESATFSLYNMRKTQMAHGIFSEAITRFTKGQPAARCPLALAYATSFFTFNPLYGTIEQPNPSEPIVVKITTSEINDLLGTNYDTDLIVKTLENVGFTVIIGGRDKSLPVSSGKSNDGSFLGDPQSRRGPSDEPRNDRKEPRRESLLSRIGDAAESSAYGREERPKKESVGDLPRANKSPEKLDGDLLTITSPLWRTDIHIKQDITEEVGRLLGFDNIPLTFPLRPARGTEPNPLHLFKTTLRRLLSDRLGTHEVLTYSFVSDQLLTQTGFNPSDSYKITNSISPELQRFRPALTPSLLSKIRTNLKAGYHNFTLYEINQVSSHATGLDEDGVPVVHNHLSIITTGDYYQIKALTKALFQDLHLKVQYGTFTDQAAYPFFEPLHSVSLINNSDQKPKTSKVSTKTPTAETSAETFGSFGEIKSPILKRFKLDNLTISALELDLDQLQHQPAQPAIDFTTSKFPSVARDLTVQVSTTTSFSTISDTLHGVLASIALGNSDGVQDPTENLIYSVTPTSIYQKSADASDKHLSFHIEFASPIKTLQAADISDIMEKITEALSAVDATII